LIYGNLCHNLVLEENLMATMNISLTDGMKNWVETQSKQGSYANSSDYVRDLIRRDQARTQVIRDVQNALDAGRNSGSAVTFDPKSFKQQMQG
jgi:antitoxin ParD1/3/4